MSATTSKWSASPTSGARLAESIRRLRTYALTWEHGELSGDPAAIMGARTVARVLEAEGVAIGIPTGPVVRQNYLADLMAAKSLPVSWVFRPGAKVTDDIAPPLSPVPERDLAQGGQGRQGVPGEHMEDVPACAGGGPAPAR